MTTNQNHQLTPPKHPQGCSGHNERPQDLPPDDDADFGPLRTYVVVTRGLYCFFVFFVVLALLEGTALLCIFRHLWHAMPPGAR